MLYLHVHSLGNKQYFSFSFFGGKESKVNESVSRAYLSCHELLLLPVCHLWCHLLDLAPHHHVTWLLRHHSKAQGWHAHPETPDWARIPYTSASSRHLAWSGEKY